MRNPRLRLLLRRGAGAVIAPLLVMGCGGAEPGDAPSGSTWAETPDSSARIGVIAGLDGPESVMYDSLQDVYFISNFTGDAGEADANGYVTSVAAGNGIIREMRFARGTERFPFHSGRGMTIQGDTLWVADLGGVHGFHRESGEQLVFVDLAAFEPGFLNDVAADGTGAVYVTDTGTSRILRIRPGPPSVAVEDPALGAPNGILWDEERGAFWIAPWSGGEQLRLWDPESGVSLGWETPGAGNMDGLVWWDGHLLVASQADSAIHAVSDDRTGPWIRTRGRPADLGLDTRRGRLAIPEVALDQVEIWKLPGG